MSLSQLKILPFMIVVAMMAFSVRLVEVASGISSLSGAAYAVEASKQDKKQPVPESAQKENTEAEEIVLAQAETEEVSEDKSNPNANTKPKIDWVDSSDSEIDYNEVRLDIFKDLSARQDAVEARERQLVAREALLEAAEQEIDRKFQEMRDLRSQIESLLETQSEEEQRRIESLVKIYEGMKPKDAADIFNTLDLDILVAVMSQMSERRLSPVLAAMTPERARSVTILLAEQKKLPELPVN